jgi:glyoxylase I family protein
MIEQIYHVGLTVRDLDRSVRFYRDILGLQYQGEILMEGKETEAMFQRPGCRARVAYLNGAAQLQMPPVELIMFLGEEIRQQPMDLFSTAISELCFYTDDAEGVYRKLIGHGVECLSTPQEFDFRAAGFGRSKAFYFRDPDGIILEIMEPLED